MRKLLISCALVCALAVVACTKVTTNPDGTTTTVSLTASEALTQAQGAATALAALSQESPMSDATKQQASNWATWLGIALKAAGIVATVAGV